MKNKKSARQHGRSMAFTLAEILVVIGIIAILIALLIPALATVKRMAKEAQQKAQLTTIELAILAFKNDRGDYPQSKWNSSDYCGAQELSEALVGWDLLGFHPDSDWRADGYDKDGGPLTYDPAKTRDSNPLDGIPDTLTERKGPYLELATANVFKLGDLFADASSLSSDAPNTHVICDVFGVKQITIGGKIVKAGTPILYYKADSNKKTISTGNADARLYNARDNLPFTTTFKSISGDKDHPLGDATGTYKAFYDYIADPKITTIKWPSNPDSYLLISAGQDGLYGTKDDICNFDPNYLPG